MCIAIVGGAVPALWSGLLLILLFSRGSGLLGLFPSQGFPNDRLGDAGRAMASLRAAGVGHRHHRRRGHHALYACRSWGMPRNPRP